MIEVDPGDPRLPGEDEADPGELIGQNRSFRLGESPPRCGVGCGGVLPGVRIERHLRELAVMLEDELIADPLPEPLWFRWDGAIFVICGRLLSPGLGCRRAGVFCFIHHTSSPIVVVTI